MIVFVFPWILSIGFNEKIVTYLLLVKKIQISMHGNALIVTNLITYLFTTIKQSRTIRKLCLGQRPKIKDEI